MNRNRKSINLSLGFIKREIKEQERNPMVCLITALCLGDQTIPPGTPVSVFFNSVTSEAIIRN